MANRWHLNTGVKDIKKKIQDKVTQINQNLKVFTFALWEVRDPTECVSDGRDDLMVHVQHIQAVHGERWVIEEEPVQ